jgi:hypothetical protein
MASPLVNAADIAFLPAVLAAKRSEVLKHIARSERLAAVCPASRLEVRPRPEMLSSGIAALDAIAGGIPRGYIAEIFGNASSGKTSALLAVLSHATRQDENCVLIDASDSFDPKSADAAGVNFSRLLWVRCGGERGRQGRSKAANISNNQLRTSARRTTHDKRQTTSEEPRAKSREPKANGRDSEFRLEQVLKAADLILHSGGFGLVVLDLAGIPQKFVRRIPLASWFRFQRAVHTRTALLVISDFACAQTCAALVLKFEKQLSPVSCRLSTKPQHSELLTEDYVQAELIRSRLERKPVQSVTATFSTEAVRIG